MKAGWSMGLCWLGSLLLTALLGTLALRPVERPVFDFGDAEIAVVGSSLSLFAVPASGSGESSLLQDGRSHVRMGLLSASAAETEDLLAQAIEQHKMLILLEVRPFIFVHNNQIEGRLCADLWCETQQHIANLRGNFSDHYRLLLNRPANYTVRLGQGTGTLGALNEGFSLREPLSKAYPVSFLAEDPSVKLQSLVRQAREQDTRIILFLPPRSPTATAYIGPEETAEIERRARHYADVLQLPIFNPDVAWSDEDFIDRGHMGRSGRAKFISALRLWWSASQ